MKKTLALLLSSFVSLTALADPGDDKTNQGNPSTNIPGSGTVIIRPKVYDNIPIDPDVQSGSVIVWASLDNPVIVHVIDTESGFTLSHTSICPEIIQIPQGPNVVCVTNGFDGEVILYTYTTND